MCGDIRAGWITILDFHRPGPIPAIIFLTGRNLRGDGTFPDLRLLASVRADGLIADDDEDAEDELQADGRECDQPPIQNPLLKSDESSLLDLVHVQDDAILDHFFVRRDDPRSRWRHLYSL